MNTTIPEEFLTAFSQLWQLPVGMDSNAVLQSSQFLHLRQVIDTHCYAQVLGNLHFLPLLWGLKKLGVPCLFEVGSALAATDMMETADRCYAALMQQSARETYLCPLDCAGNLPEIVFGNSVIKRFTAPELDALLNGTKQQRQPGYRPVDIRMLSKLTWLVVDNDSPLPATFSARYLSLNDPSLDGTGTVYPYKHHYPDAVEHALFVLMLAPWEEWMDSYNNLWCPFDIPWVHTLYSDIFQWHYPLPEASTLTIIPSSFMVGGEWIEEDVLAERTVYLGAEELRPFVDESMRNSLLIAIKNGLINAAAQHQFVKAFMSSGVDEFLAHIVVIDACVGEKSPRQGMDKKYKDLKPTGRMKYRLAGLLGDATVVSSMDVLYAARSDYVHGNPLEKITGENLIQARVLARRTLNAVIAVAGQEPSLTREAFLEEALRSGWKLIKDQ